MSSQQNQPDRPGQPDVHEHTPLPSALPSFDETQPEARAGRTPPRHHVPRRARTWRTLLGVGMSFVLMSGLGVTTTSSSQPERTLVVDSFERSDARSWNTPGAGGRWLYPAGRAGVALSAGSGVMRVTSRGRMREAMLNTTVRDVTARFDLSIDQVAGRSGVMVSTVLRKSKAGAYHARTKVDRDGAIWLSIVKVARDGSSRWLGSPVLVRRARYQEGQRLTVRAQAIGRAPSQIRMMVWPSDGQQPRAWQLVRNDSTRALGLAGRVGVRTELARPTPRTDATVHIDNVRITRSPNLPLVGATGKSATRKTGASKDTTRPRILSRRTGDTTPTRKVTTGPSVYGPAMRGDGKGNAEIGRGWGDIALRFRASSSSAPSYLKWSCRTGSGGYSGGNGGTIRIGIMADDGTAQHHPDGKWLTYTDVKPGNPGSDERFLRTDFSGAPALVAGELYHVVFRNISPDPYADWVSLNNLTMNGGYTDYSRRQPAFADTDLEFLREGPNWKAMDWKADYYTPFFDLALADSTHEGNAYGFADYHYDRLISGTTQMVRERFTVSGGDKTVTEVYVAIARQSGAGDVTIRLEDASGGRIDSITVSGSHIGASTPGDRQPPQEWIGGAFPSAHTLSDGKTYRLRVHSASGSTYFARPIFWEQGFQEGSPPQSWRFADGISSNYGGGEYTTNSGGSWSPMYAHLLQDLPFYFVAS